MPDSDPRQSVRIPGWFVSETAPRIREMVELQVMLAYFRLTAASEWAEPIAESVLIEDAALNLALKFDAAPRKPVDQIKRGIELAVARDTLLRFSTGEGEEEDTTTRWLLLAIPENRVKLDRYRSGILKPPVQPGMGDAASNVTPVRPGVFKLYEQNVGLVTPIIADRLVEALELYPEAWIEDAIAAAVSYNRRNWRYIQRILETWATEGRSNEANRRHQSGTGDFDPERHLSGEYAAVFRRRRRE